MNWNVKERVLRDWSLIGVKAIFNTVVKPIENIACCKIRVQRLGHLGGNVWGHFWGSPGVSRGAPFGSYKVPMLCNFGGRFWGFPGVPRSAFKRTQQMSILCLWCPGSTVSRQPLRALSCPVVLTHTDPPHLHREPPACPGHAIEAQDAG